MIDNLEQLPSTTVSAAPSAALGPAINGLEQPSNDLNFDKVSPSKRINFKNQLAESAQLLMPTAHLRLPLKETSGNVPSPSSKKTKLFKQYQQHKSQKPTTTAITPITTAITPKVKPQRQERLQDEELRNWQLSWKKIMLESVVYFDPNGYDESNHSHKRDRKIIIQAMESFGCRINQFFDAQEVTILVTRREHKAVLTNKPDKRDLIRIAAQHNLKIWDIDKTYRFLKNLTGIDYNDPNSINLHKANQLQQKGNNNLSALLSNEKIMGPTDRDLTAKRDDFHYLGKYYFFVFDLYHKTRPVAVREWTDSKESPSFHVSTDGRCPFLSDPSNYDDAKKKERRRLKFIKTRNERLKLIRRSFLSKEKLDAFEAKLRELYPDEVLIEEEKAIDNSACSSTEDSICITSHAQKRERSPDDEEENEKYKMFKKSLMQPPKPNLIRNSSVLTTNNSNSNSKAAEIQASGYNQSNDSTVVGNGLAPTFASNQNKNFQSLKNNFLKQSVTSNKNLPKPSSKVVEKKKDEKPGYCENCRERYNSFDAHIASRRHRAFALNNENFEDIDRLIEIINNEKILGRVQYLE